jgi:hypothetical protein
MATWHWILSIAAVFVALLVLGARYDRPRHQRRWAATVSLFPAPDLLPVKTGIFEFSNVPYQEYLRVPGAGSRFLAFALPDASTRRSSRWSRPESGSATIDSTRAATC